jgi:CheY-like chemotaxis protein
MDGVQAAARIHAQAKLSRTSIFVVSAYLTEEIERDVRAAGCVEGFAKPVDGQELLEKFARRSVVVTQTVSLRAWLKISRAVRKLTVCVTEADHNSENCGFLEQPTLSKALDAEL